MNQEDVLKRIQNCLSLAENAAATENEAATALRQAQALMKKYNVSPDMLGKIEIADDVILCPSAWSKVPEWETMLIATLCRAFGARASLQTFPAKFERLAEFHIVGVKHQLPAIKYAYGVLRRQILKARGEYQLRHCVGMRRGEKISAGESFCQGFVLKVIDLVDDFAMKPEQKEEINRRVEEGTRGSYKAPKTKRNYDALREGAEAGATARLHRPVK